MKRRHFCYYCLLFLVGCQFSQGQKPFSVKIPDDLQFAVTDVQGMGELKQNYDSLRIELQKLLQTPIDFFPVENYLAAAAALQSHRVDLVLAGPSEYVAIKARTNAIPIVAITRPHYYTVIMVRLDSGLQTLRDLKGKTLDIRSIGSTSSHLGAIQLLMEAGLNPQTDIKLIASGDDGLTPLKTGQADAIARSSYFYPKNQESNICQPQNCRILAKGTPLPHDIFVAGSHLSLEIVKQIRSLLLAHQDQLLKAVTASEELGSKYQDSQLIIANDADYDAIRQIYQVMGQGEFLN